MFLLIFVLTTGFLVGFFFLVIWYTSTSVRVLVGSKHNDADFIVSSGMAPPEWKRRPAVCLGPMVAKRYANYRINKLINYYRRTPLVDSETVRSERLGELRSIKLKWRKSTWGDIFPYTKV